MPDDILNLTWDEEKGWIIIRFNKIIDCRNNEIVPMVVIFGYGKLTFHRIRKKHSFLERVKNHVTSVVLKKCALLVLFEGDFGFLLCCSQTALFDDFNLNEVG